jgi:ADP-ribose pyrophosphatase YjhB (NUDIX family)
MKDIVPDCFYRISAKALILNNTRDKFLIVQEDDGRWDLPGGGLDWGMTPQEDIPREIMEEMGLKTTFVADRPSYFLTFGHSRTDTWMSNVLYETKLESLNFTPSRECTVIQYVDKNDIEDLVLHANLEKLITMFDPNFHLKE